MRFWLSPMAAVLALGVSGLGSVSPAFAREMLAPRVDYVASYRLDPDGETMRMAHHGGKIRMETTAEGQTAVILMDPAAQQILMLLQGMAMRMDMRRPMPGRASFKDGAAGLATDVAVEPQPLGTKVIAGLNCTVYEAVCESSGGAPVHSRVCLTEDRVLLESVSQDHGKPFVLTATAVEIGPQDPALFTLPPGVQVMDMPSMP